MPETASLILHAAGEGIYGLDAEGLTTFVNPAAEALVGWTAAEMVGKPQHALIHHSHQDGSLYPRETCPIYMALRDGLIHRSDSEIFWRKDGTSFPVSYTSTPILRDGVPRGAVVIFQDISERKRRELWEREKTSIFSAIARHAELDCTFQMIAQAFVVFQPRLSIALFLRDGLRFKEVTHGSAGPEAFSEDLIDELGSACAQVAKGGLPVVASRSGIDSSDPDCIFRQLLRDSSFNICVATPLVSCSGEVLGAVTVLSTSGQTMLLQAQDSARSVCDIARMAIEHYQLNATLIRSSQHDALTGLPNRHLLEDRLRQAITSARRSGNQVAAGVLDLDRFKNINDAVGHSDSDQYLQRVARILCSNVRDIDTVARQGGDEFLFVFPELESEQDALAICERILQALRSPISVDEKGFITTASIGISFYGAGGDTAALLLRNADTALYAAKQSGRDRLQHYEPCLGEKAQRVVTIQSALRLALAARQLSLHYQPLYSATMKLLGFETLLRWSHPLLGNISPGVFTPIAEETGLIVTIGEWVLEEACRQAQVWSLASGTPVRIFINISGVQLSRPDFVSTVTRVLAHTHLVPAQLELEITESWLMADIAAAAGRIAEIRELGISVAIDDFGTGHSSLASLHLFSVDTIKIDQSFVSRLDGSPQSQAIIRTIVELASQLGLNTVVEGIETEAQLNQLQSLHCDILQGYLLGKPLSSSAAGALLAREARCAGVSEALWVHAPASNEVGPSSF